MKGLWLLSVSAAIAASAHLGRSAYLPRVGIMPLREEKPIDPALRYEMKPLEEARPVVIETNNEPASPTATGATNSIPTADPGTAPAISTNEPAPPVALPSSPSSNVPAQPAPAAPGSPAVTPQMFLRFFNRNGTGDTTVVLPNGAAQPANAPGSSTATYIVK
ncbi:MAG TPA: hypothetical protein VEH27_13265 [Methylomirabilota bacterium]|nr:hypothetical protein [Methylomirabilota bacterium]